MTTRPFPVTLPTGEKVGMVLADAPEDLRELTWPGQPRFLMIAAPHESDAWIAAEAAAFVADADRLSPAQFAREGRLTAPEAERPR